MRRTVPDALNGVSSLGVDTAPLIAYVQAEAATLPVCDIVFNAVKAGSLFISVSAIALTECLVHPLKMNDTVAVRAYEGLFRGRNVTCLPVSRRIARRAAELRAQYNLRTPDALHIATALIGNCDAFLTNDRQLRRVTEIPVLILSDLDP